MAMETSIRRREAAPMRIIDVGSGCRGTVCIDGRCLICRADWLELAWRMGLYAECEGCGVCFEPDNAKRYCSIRCQHNAQEQTRSPEQKAIRKERDRLREQLRTRVRVRRRVWEEGSMP